MKTLRPLRTALYVNAIFSAGCALMLLTLPDFVRDLLKIPNPLLERLIGFGLLIFSLDLIHQATRPRLATWRALYTSISDFLWVVASLLVLWLFPELFSVTGIKALTVVAVVVFTTGLWQIWGIGRAHQSANPLFYRHCLVIRTQIPAADMWDVIERMGDIQDYMPSLARSEILDGKVPGVSAVRRCIDKSGRCWSEECVGFEPGRSLTMRFVSEEPNFPFPFSIMFGGWEVIPTGNTASDVRVWWEVVPKIRFLMPVLMPIMAFNADRDFVHIIRRMANDALKQNDSGESGQQVWLARFLPIIC